MQEQIYIAQILSGIFYIAVGARLLRLAQRTREPPERLLGLYFVATGVAYLIYFVPDIVESAAFAGAWQFASRLAYLLAIVAILTFTRVTFRPDDRWAKGLVGVLSLVICGGLMSAAASGAWETSVESAGWWLEFGGYSAALVWFAWEASCAWSGARKRMRLGLCTSLLRDGGYFGFDRGDCLHGQLWWFDEYDADIGAPVEEFKNGALGAGIYSRQYDSGLVVINPSERPVALSFSKPHFDYSSKTTASKHVIPPHDGRILRAGGHE